MSINPNEREAKRILEADKIYKKASKRFARSKLCLSDVIAIRVAYRHGETVAELAARFKATERQIQYAISRVSPYHETGNILRHKAHFNTKAKRKGGWV